MRCPRASTVLEPFIDSWRVRLSRLLEKANTQRVGVVLTECRQSIHPSYRLPSYVRPLLSAKGLGPKTAQGIGQASVI
jgi:hypothetical protein